MFKHSIAAAALLASIALMQGCAPLLIGGAVVSGALVATDRRTSGAQLEDQGIEMRTANRISQQMKEKNHISVTSYNRRVLLTGEVPSEEYKLQAEKIAQGVDNVLQVYNELAVMPNSSMSDRASDAIVSTRVRAALLDAKDIYAKSVVVTTERNIVYILGRVTEREAARITDIASTTKGVQKVVRLFDIISEEELKNTLPQAPKPSPTPAPIVYSNKPAEPQVPVNPPAVIEKQAPAPVESRPYIPPTAQ